MEITNILIAVFGTLLGILLSIIGYFMKTSFEKINKRLDKHEEKLNKMSNSLAKIQVWEDFISVEVKNLKDRLAEFDTNILKFYKDYQESLDFVKRNSNGLMKLIAKVDNISA